MKLGLQGQDLNKKIVKIILYVFSLLNDIVIVQDDNKTTTQMQLIHLL